ncbi:MAG: hypothetical protein E4H14_13685 [Candidatus Thorarchaeota archaeon]|nr:MAG: hypothetical protein E4H14_13685 [Candidatus Thorarchaeota archaeon]
MTFFAGLVIMAILAVTGIIPLSLQPPFVIMLVATMITGAVISLAAHFKSFVRNAYPFSIVIFLFVTTLFVFLYLTTR